MANKTMYVIRYGFNYEHDNILGVYNSYYYAGKAKKELFAEVGALYSSGRKDIIPTNILDIFEDTIKGLKNAN